MQLLAIGTSLPSPFSGGHVEYYADVYSPLDKKIGEKLLFSGDEADARFPAIKADALKFMDRVVENFKRVRE